MSYPHLTPEMTNECSRAAHAYDPDCYCAIHWVYADYVPRPQYRGMPTKWLEAYVWRSIGPGQPDRFVVSAVADNGPELLRDLHTVLAAITEGEQIDPSLPAHHEPPQRFVRRNPRPRPIGFLTAAQRATTQDESR